MNTAAIHAPSCPTIGKWSGRQLETMRRTIAPDATDSEFQQFIEYAIAKQLDPFVGDVILVIYGKNAKDPSKRKPTIITTQSGCRKLAARCGDYRPAEEEPTFEYNEKLKNPTNPLGIVKCSTTLWKQDKHSHEWKKVSGWAYWDECAAVKEAWGEDESGKRRPTGKSTLEGNWSKMGRIMIAKNATMVALRAGWPETFEHVYSEEEMDRSRVLDLDATALIEHEQQERRQKQIAMDQNELPFVDDDGALMFMQAGVFADLIIKLARDYATSEQLASMRSRNREGLRRFWAMNKNDALELHEELEKIAKSFLSQKEQKVSA